MAGWALAVDFGTSNTVAVLRRPDGRISEVLFDSSPLLPSAVCADADGTLLTGRDALRSARLAPERFEPNPKLRIDDGTVLLGTEVPVVRLAAAVLARAADEARRITSGALDQVVLTHPAGWGPRRRAVLEEAAAAAGLADLTMLPEPVAAARWFQAHHRPAAGPVATRVPAGEMPVVIYDLGGGTLDVAVVLGDRVLACDGLTDVGGLDINAGLRDQLAAQLGEPADWQPVRQPRTSADRRQLRQFQDDVREAKEMLSRTAQTFIHLPFLDLDAPLNRDQVEAVAGPLIDRTLACTRATLTAAGLPIPLPGPLYLVGGATRMPLVATALHRALKSAPVVAEQPELVVAQGALLATEPTRQPQSAGPGIAGGSGDPAASVPARAGVVQRVAARPGVLDGHGGPVGAVAFSADGSLLASNSGDHTIRLWDPASHRTVAVLAGGKGRTDRLGQWSSLGGASPYLVEFCPDGQQLVSVSNDRAVRLWSVASGNQIDAFASRDGLLTMTDARVHAMAVSADGHRLASGGDGPYTRLWDLRTGVCLARLKNGTEGRVTSVAFSPDGRLLATTGGAGSDGVCVWDVAGEQRIATVRGVFTALAFSSDGALLACQGDAGITLWDVGRRDTIRTIRHPGTQLVFAPNSRTLATCAADGRVTVWDAITGGPLTSPAPPTTRLHGVAFSPDGTILAGAGWDRKIHLWPL